ncbi:MAG: ATP-grasp fold amidoligase family protein [Actinomycetota bacterium]
MQASRNPQAFNDKLQRRMLLDRREFLTTFADKYSVRNCVENRVGAQYLTKLFKVWNEPSEIELNGLPNNFVLKATHGSGAMVIVWDGAPHENELPIDPENSAWGRFLIRPENLDPARLKKLIAHWFSLNYYRETGYIEWAYKNVVPRVIVEELLIESSGEIPIDYKFFMMDGKCSMIQVDQSRFSDHHRNLYDSSWNLLPCENRFPQIEQVLPKPESLESMIDLSEKISTGIDFVRVDLYSTNQGIKFGELTNYPNAGGDFFRPKEFDYWLGSRWKLDKETQEFPRKLGIFLFPLLVLAACLIIKTQNQPLYTTLIGEDAFFEDFQFIFYSAGCLVAALCCYSLFRAKEKLLGTLFGFASIVLFVVSGEEISWGQRMLSFKTPKYFETRNVQDELSLHNLGYLQSKLANGYIAVGLIGAFLWIVLRYFDPQKKSFLNRLAPDWYLTLYFLVPGMIYTYFQFSQFLVKETGRTFLEINKFFVWRDQEPAETLLSLGILIFLTTTYFESQRARRNVA